MASECNIFFTKGHLLAGCGMILSKKEVAGTTETGYSFFNEFTKCRAEFRVGGEWRVLPPAKCYLPVVASALNVLAKGRDVDLKGTM
jgi:hypothetical protein